MEELLAQIPNWVVYSFWIGIGSVGFRVAAELFNKIAEHTENKVDDVWAQRIATASWELAKFLAYFGIRAGLAIPRHLKDSDDDTT